MANQPKGREKNVTGKSGDLGRKGSGLGTGPVGNKGGYSGRPGTGSQQRNPGSVPGRSSGQPQIRGQQNPGQRSGSSQRGIMDQLISGAVSSGDSSDNTSGSSGSKKKKLRPIVIILVIIVGFFLIKSLMNSASTVTLSSDYDESLISDAEKPGDYGYGGQSGSSYGSGSAYSGSSYYSSYSELFGTSGYTNHSTSSGWTLAKNTGKLSSTVVSGARGKRTEIIGNGNDVVTIMIYMCGTDLESQSGMASSDLKEMANATIGENVNLIVYTGGCKRWQTSGISSSVNQIYKVESSSVKRIESDAGNAAMTNPDTLSGFIRYCDKNYPANRNILVFWDHGGGSLSGYGYDEKYSSSGSMDLAGIREALEDGNVSFDIIGFDACLMATVETGLTLADYADYMVASEETEPGYGWYYTDWLTEISANTSMSSLNIGKNIVDSFVSYCERYTSGQKATLSVVDLAELEKTAPASLKAFSTSLSGLMDEDGYQTVSDARGSAREFAQSSKIDQIDIVSFANGVGTEEAQELVEAMLGAVKYNQTSSNMTDAYGLSIYFPYQKLSKVDTALSLYDEIGMDDDYAKAVQEFASMETSGQAASGGTGSALYSLLENYSGSYSSYGSSSYDTSGSYSSGSTYSGYSSSDMISSILGSLLGGSYKSIDGLDESNSRFLDGSIDIGSAAEYIQNNYFDISGLIWEETESGYGMKIPAQLWNLVHDLELNVFYDDGEGFIDLGLDSVFEISENGVLSGLYDGTWTGINGRAVAFYFEDTVYDGDNWTMTGRVPVLLNGQRAELVLIFDNENPSGYVAGARRVYSDGETETVARGLMDIVDGDVIDFICDYYSYEGEYQDTYVFGDSLTVDGEFEISYVELPDISLTNAVYRFTDIFNQHFWTPVMQNAG